MRSFLPSAFLVSACLAFRLTAAPVVFTIDPGGGLDVTVGVAGEAPAETRLNLSGTFSADVLLYLGDPNWIRFNGGDIQYSDTNLEAVVARAGFPPFEVVTKVRVETREIVAGLESPHGLAPVDLASGTIDPAGHLLVQDRGTITTKGLVGGTTVVTETRSLAQQPDRSALSGTTTLSATLLEDLGWAARYRLDLVHQRDDTRSEFVAAVGKTVTKHEVGGFTASAEGLFPGPDFIAWAWPLLGYEAEHFNERLTPAGPPLILAYAFRGEASSWSPPLEMGPGGISLSLPEEGLRAPVAIELSQDLGATGWSRLALGTGGETVFPVGEAGPRTLPAPASPHGFARLSLAP